MMRVAGVLLALVMTATGASAATMQAVYTGTVGAGFDDAGLFGTPGSDISGLSFGMTFTYDTALGARSTTPPTSAGWSDVVTGGVFAPGTTSPMISASLTINGATQLVTGAGDGTARTRSDANFNGGPLQLFETYAVDFDATGSFPTAILFSSISNAFLGIPSNLDTPFSLTGLSTIPQPGPSPGYSGFDFLRMDAVTGGLVSSASGTLLVDTLTVSQVGVAPVPLPASALLLLAALVAVRSVHRRRSQV